MPGCRHDQSMPLPRQHLLGGVHDPRPRMESDRGGCQKQKGWPGDMMKAPSWAVTQPAHKSQSLIPLAEGRMCGRTQMSHLRLRTVIMGRLLSWLVPASKVVAATETLRVCVCAAGPAP